MAHKLTLEEQLEELFSEYALVEISLKNDLPQKEEVCFEAYDPTELQVLLMKGLENFSVVELKAIK